ncbi:unnamed protein product, partial [Oppiella nova]
MRSRHKGATGSLLKSLLTRRHRQSLHPINSLTATPVMSTPLPLISLSMAYVQCLRPYTQPQEPSDQLVDALVTTAGVGVNILAVDLGPIDSAHELEVRRQQAVGVLAVMAVTANETLSAAIGLYGQTTVHWPEAGGAPPPADQPVLPVAEQPAPIDSDSSAASSPLGSSSSSSAAPHSSPSSAPTTGHSSNEAIDGSAVDSSGGADSGPNLSGLESDASHVSGGAAQQMRSSSEEGTDDSGGGAVQAKRGPNVRFGEKPFTVQTVCVLGDNHYCIGIESHRKHWSTSRAKRLSLKKKITAEEMMKIEEVKNVSKSA